MLKQTTNKSVHGTVHIVNTRCLFINLYVLPVHLSVDILCDLCVLNTSLDLFNSINRERVSDNYTIVLMKQQQLNKRDNVCFQHIYWWSVSTYSNCHSNVPRYLVDISALYKGKVSDWIPGIGFTKNL